MDGFVVDASVALAWFFHDEETPFTRQLLQQLVDGETVAPSIWPYEMANALAIAERKQRITALQIDAHLARLRRLRVRVARHGSARIFGEVVQVCRLHQLSAYDAAYLELALRLGLPLATLDGRLKRAAVSAGVAVIDGANGD